MEHTNQGTFLLAILAMLGLLSVVTQYQSTLEAIRGFLMIVFGPI